MEDKKVKARIKELNDIFADIPESKKILLKSTIETVAFMDIQIKDLEKVIGTGMSTTPEKQLYASLAKTRDGLIKKLMTELPTAPKENSKLESFLSE